MTKHFTTEEWIDFVNQAVSLKDRGEMENHLKEGCRRCRQAASLWQRVQKSAAAEQNYQPPENTQRIVKSAFAAARLEGQRKESRSRISVLFDSLFQPAVAGARSAATDSRQMLYRADPFQIDLQAVSNQHGEFTCDLKNSGDLQITFSTPRGEPIVISLRDALGRMPLDGK